MIKNTNTAVNRILSYLVLAVMLAASVWLWLFMDNTQTTRAQSHFDLYCEQISHSVTTRLHDYKMILKGGAGLFVASEAVTREEWRTYVEYRQVQTLYPGIQGMGFARVIPAAELGRHVESIRATGFPEYAVWPEGERAIYTPIVFLEPFDERNRRALGYDMFSEPVRRAALERARDTAMPALSGRVRLVQETGEEVQAGFLLYVPLFARGMATGSVEERRAALTGYVYAAFRVKSLMRAVFGKAPEEVAFELYDGPTASPEALLFESRDLEGGFGSGHRPRFSQQDSLELYGHTWTLAFRSTPQFEAREASNLSWIILVGGIVISILIFLLIRSQQSIIIKARTIAADLSRNLRESEQRLIHLYTVSPAVIYTLDPADFSPTSVSPSVSAVTGYAPDEVVKPGWWAGCLHPEDREQALRKSAAVFDTGRIAHEYRIQRKDGTFIWIQNELRLMRDDQGQPLEIVGSWLDVTERKQAEMLASTEHQRLLSVLNTLPGFVCLIGPDYSLPFVNAEFKRRFGDPEGRRYFELLFGRDGKCDTCRYFEVFETKAPLEWDWIGPDQRTYRIYDYPYTDSDGSLLVLELGLDITEHAKALAELAESESRFSKSFQYSTIGKALIAPDGSFLKANQALCQMFGYSEEELLHRTSQELTHPDDLEADLANVRQMLSGAIHTYRMEKRYFHKNGQTIWALLSVSLVRDSEGQPLYFISQIQDLAERKEAEADQIARRAAEEANRAKSAFLSNMSHEIRTPLNAILGFAQILERDPSLTPRQAGMLHTIGRSGQHLLDLINDILDMSKIEAGRLELNPVDFCLHDLLDDLEAMFQSRAQAKGLQLLMERADGLPRYVHADEAKLRQVLINLVGNAVKFTKTGGGAVRVRVNAEPDGADGNAITLCLVVEVEDSGPGIAEEDLVSIFEPFRQSAAGRDEGGTGLGLAVSRRLVELMGGRLTVQSELGEGTCFRFDAVVKLAAEAPRENVPAMRLVVGLEPGTGPFRILVADDQKDNRDLLAALLEPVGFEIREAANGQEALEVFEAWSPHAVLMDMRMPVLDGYEASRRIKATVQGRATPVIAVTATSFTDAIETVMATGVDAYVRKPFRQDELFAVLEKCLGLRYVYADSPRQALKQNNVHPLSREDLAPLPEELRQAMRQAVAEGDMTILHELINQVEGHDVETARKLRILADRYDYESLTKVLEEEKSGAKSQENPHV